MSLNYNFIWLLCYLLVLVGLAGYGFHRLSIVYLYWKNRNNKPQPKARFPGTARRDGPAPHVQ